MLNKVILVLAVMINFAYASNGDYADVVKVLKSNNQNTAWIPPADLKTDLAQKKKKLAGGLKSVPLFGETCDNIAYNGAFEQMGIEYLELIKETILDMTKPFTSMSNFEKAVFKLSFAWCIRRTLPESLAKSVRKSMYALQGVEVDYNIVGNPLVGYGFEADYNADFVLGVLRAIGQGFSEGFDSFIEDTFQCTFETRKEKVAMIYRATSWNLMMRIGYLTSIANMCNFKLKKEGETPDWKKIIPSLQEAETGLNDWVNSKNIGGEFSFSFSQHKEKIDRCIGGKSTLTGESCATKRELELAKIRNDKNYELPVSDNYIEEFQQNILAHESMTSEIIETIKKPSSVSVSTDNLFKSYNGIVSNIFNADENLNSRQHPEVRSAFIDIFIRAYRPSFIISSLNYGAKEYGMNEPSKSYELIKKNAKIHNSIPFYSVYYLSGLLGALEAYQKEFNVADNQSYIIKLQYKKNNNFDYYGTLLDSCRMVLPTYKRMKHEDYVKAITEGKNIHQYIREEELCPSYFRNVFKFISNTLKPHAGLGDLLSEIEADVGEMGEDESRASIELTEDLLESKSIKELGNIYREKVVENTK
jgi:ribosomal protein S17E